MSDAHGAAVKGPEESDDVLPGPCDSAQVSGAFHGWQVAIEEAMRTGHQATRRAFQRDL